MIKQSDIVFAYDFERLADDNSLFDYGPHSLHAKFPGGIGDPTRENGCYFFNANDYLTLPQNFYSVAPTSGYTWLYSFISSDSLSAGTARRLFSADNNGAGGLWTGIQLAHQANVQRTYMFNFKNGATQDYAISAAAPPYVQINQKYNIVSTVETTPKALHNSTTSAYSWSVGSYGTTVYDSSKAVYIGTDNALTRYLVGRLFCLVLINKVITIEEMSDLSEQMMMGKKPFCVRQ